MGPATSWSSLESSVMSTAVEWDIVVTYVGHQQVPHPCCTSWSRTSPRILPWASLWAPNFRGRRVSFCSSLGFLSAMRGWDYLTKLTRSQGRGSRGAQEAGECGQLSQRRLARLGAAVPTQPSPVLLSPTSSVNLGPFPPSVHPAAALAAWPSCSEVPSLPGSG